MKGLYIALRHFWRENTTARTPRLHRSDMAECRSERVDRIKDILEGISLSFWSPRRDREMGLALSADLSLSAAKNLSPNASLLSSNNEANSGGKGTSTVCPETKDVSPSSWVAVSVTYITGSSIVCKHMIVSSSSLTGTYNRSNKHYDYYLI